MRAHLEVGICCPMFTDSNGQMQSSVYTQYFGDRYVPNVFNQLPGYFAWASGAALMISRNIFMQVCGFDERYFMYLEDVDLGLTVRKAGFEISEVRNAKIMHLGGQSAKKAWTYKEGILRLELARSIFTAKNYLLEQHKYIWKKYRIKKRLDIIRNYLFLQSKRLPSNLEKFRFASHIYFSLK